MTDSYSGLHDPYTEQLAAARYRADRDALAQAMQRVADSMREHALGMEGMEDSPVASWARDLRAALGSLHAPGFQKSRKVATSLTSHSDASDVTMSAHDLLPEEERESIAWVREHGGLGTVEARLMPEGMEWLVEAWPRFEDGEPVSIGDEYECWCCGTHRVNSVTIREGSSTINATNAHSFVVSDGPATAHGKRVRRPAPKVLDADGVEIRVRDTVYLLPGDWCDKFPLLSCHEWGAMKVLSLRPNHDTSRIECETSPGSVVCYPQPSQLTNQRPVLDADGVPIHEGDHGWWVEQPGVEIVVKHIDPDECDQLTVCDVHGRGNTISADEFTHTKPEIDTWERIEEDADALVDAEINGEGSCNAANAYCNRRGLGEGTSFVLMAQDLVRRCRALAERERVE